MKCQHDWDMENMGCVFGCGTMIRVDGFCHTCNDHSENVVFCKKCNAEAEVDINGNIKEIP